MDTPSVLNRGNKLIASLGALIVVIGFCASVVLSGLATSSDKVRVDQLRLSEFKSQFTQIPALVDTMLLGTQLNGFDSNKVRVAEQVNALGSGSVDRTLPIDWATVDRFLAGTKQEIKAISVNQFDEAAHIRQVQSEPAFNTAMRSMEARNLSLNSEAKQLRQRSQTVRNTTLLGAGLLVLLLVIGSYRSYEIVAHREQAQHARDISGLRFAALVQDSTDIILVTSRKGIVTLANNACKETWNISPRECIGKPILDLLTTSDQQELSDAISATIASPDHGLDASIRLELKAGSKHTYQVHIRNQLNNVHIGGLVFTFHDVTERAAVQEALSYEASHDRLTGLPNRSLIQVRITEALKRAKSNHSLIGALFIDLDNFKTINDTLGHEMGDALLVEVAKRIQRTIRPSDTAARLGGDEFVVILENTQDSAASIAIAQRLSEQFARPFQLGDELRIITASIGIAISDEGDTEPSDILRKADVAMYQAKKDGKAGYSTFDPSMSMK